MKTNAQGTCAHDKDKPGSKKSLLLLLLFFEEMKKSLPKRKSHNPLLSFRSYIVLSLVVSVHWTATTTSTTSPSVCKCMHGTS